jgi:hypothetical protein
MKETDEMAGAPYKVGLGYFSHDTDLSDDPKIQFLEAETGLIGYAIYLKILEFTYRHEGYYFMADERSIKLFAKKLNLTFDVLNNGITVCVNENLFDKNMFEKYSILTSTGIQKRYLRGCDRRKKVDLNKEYLLINNDVINDNINGINVDIYSSEIDIKQENENNIGINVAKSKVKENKKKDIKQKEIIKKTEFDLTLDDFYEMRTKIKKPVTDKAKRLLIKNLEKLAPGNEQTQIEILNQSIMNCWQGVFPLKNNNGYNEPKRKSAYERNLEELGVPL